MSELGSALGTRDGKLLGESGVMTKEKLMLLIGSVPCFGEGHAAACPDRIMGSCGHVVRMDFCAIGHMADWLIANGVVVREKGEWEVGGHCNHKPCRIRHADKWTIYRCSKCGYSNGRKKRANFCPNCGADMRKGENDG